jgi:hypothetical protein
MVREPGGWVVRWGAAWIAVVLVVGAIVVVSHGPEDEALARDGKLQSGAPFTTTSPTTTSTTTTISAAPTTAAPAPTQPPATQPPETQPPATQPAPTAPAAEAPTTAVPVPVPPPALIQPAGPLPPPGQWTYDPYVGLGTWIDVYDWSATFTNDNPQISLGDIDRMANLGVQTLYVQAVRWDVETGVLEESRLRSLINRARTDGMRVVAWYLPDLRDIDADFRHLIAIAQLPIDGIGVDIESRSVEDVADRNARLLQLSSSLRDALRGQVLSAIVLPPVLMEDVNPNYWPAYPWAGLAPFYDVWQPMNYWTGRLPEWRDAYKYTAVDVQRVRARIGNPDAVVHPIGGIGDRSTPDDVTAMLQAAVDTGCVGGSLYDYRTTGDDLWPSLQGFHVS